MEVTMVEMAPVARVRSLLVSADCGGKSPLVRVDVRSERDPDYKRLFSIQSATKLARCFLGEIPSTEATADDGTAFVLRREPHKQGANAEDDVWKLSILEGSKHTLRATFNINQATALGWALKAAVVSAMEG